MVGYSRTGSGKRAVLVVCDSLRADMITPGTAPTLARLAEQWRVFTSHRGVFPSTTRTTSASMATGSLPRHHGLLGNAMAIVEKGSLVRLSTGKADFTERWRASTGRTLHRPTLAQRLAGAGGSIVFSNASPGAAHAQDPDGYGFLYNRAGSCGPGRRPVPASEHLDTPKGIAGDALATERFVEEVLLRRKPALGVLWLSEPDHTGHLYPLGGPEHLQAIAAADACVARVVEAVQGLDPDGRQTLVMVTSDHGQETTDRVIPVDQLLVEARLKASADSTDLVAAPQGTSVLFFLAQEARRRKGALLEFLAAQSWVEVLYQDRTLEGVGLHNGQFLVAAVSLRKTDRPNAHGVPGFSDIMLDHSGDLNRPGCGQHGGMGRWEQSPFLFAWGGGFAPGTAWGEPSTPMDIAPTILRHLGQPWEGMDGRPLSRH